MASVERPARVRWTTILFGLFWVFSCLAQSQTTGAGDWVYTVKPGDNLWDLSKRHLTGMHYLSKLQSLNGITNPRKLAPGSTLRIPIEWLKHSPATAVIIALKGKASITDDSISKNLSASLGSTLKTGDKLETSADSSVTVEFSDQSHVQLKSGSNLIFKGLRAFGETGIVDSLLHLENGNTAIRVEPKRKEGSRFEISTPSAVAAVRGTEYRISADAVRTESRAEVLHGEVAVTSAGQTVIIPKDFGTIVKKGEPPLAPVKLLPVPDLSALPETIRRLPFEFKFPPLVDAVAYRVDVVIDDTNDALQFEATSKVPVLTVTDLPDGSYIVHVRGVDQFGLGGINGSKKFTVDTVPKTPKPVSTPAGTSIGSARPTVAWSPVDLAISYHFQLATDGDFGSPLINTTIFETTTFSLPQSLKPAAYSWRVAALNAKNIASPYSRPQLIEVKEPFNYWLLGIFIVIPLMMLYLSFMKRKKHEKPARPT